MKLRDISRALRRRHLHHWPGAYPELTAQCSDELALIADRRRSEHT